MKQFVCSVLHSPLLRLLEECRPDLSAFNQIHAQALISGHFRSSFAASRLLKFLTQKLNPPYLHHAALLFSQISSPDLVTSNLLLQAMTQNSDPLRSFAFFRELLRRELRPNGYTFCFLFPSASCEQGLQLHGQFSKMGFLSCPYAATSLVQFYGNSGFPEDARKMFGEMPHRSDITYTVLIRSYASNGRIADAMNVISFMRKLGFDVGNSALVGVLCKCTDLGLSSIGKMVHGLIVVTGKELNITLGTSLIRMYAKLGGGGAAAIFAAMSGRSVGSWNCMIHGLAINGGGSTSICLFEKMKELKIKPDEGTYVGVLTACRHSGSVSAGVEFFSEMIGYGISPTLKHYGCLVDLYSRNGSLSEALEVARRMPMAPDAAIWGAILNACHERGELAIGEMVASKMVKVFPHECSGYLFTSGLLASSMRWEGVVAARKMMMERGMWKTSPGCSMLMQ